VSQPGPANGGRLGGALSNRQKAELCILARQAFEHQYGPVPSDAALTKFRHAEVQHATGKPGLTACVQDDYLVVKAHFLDLVGESGRAMTAHLEHETAPKRVVLHKLNEALAKAKLPMAYAAAIAKRQSGVTIEELSVNQIWKLVYTINNRGTAKRRGTTKGAKSAKGQ
jgi:hypothetical protein